MDFEDHINSNFKTKTIFEYDIDDFSKEEIKIIKIYWKKYLKNLRYLHSNLNILEIPQPRRIEISDELRNGFEQLDKKNLVINNGLR